MVSDEVLQQIFSIPLALIAIVPATLAAIWARQSKTTSAETAREIKTNGGMTDPNPNVNDHVKYQTKMIEELLLRQDNTEKMLGDHLTHSQIMDQAVAEMYLAYRRGEFTLNPPFEED